MYVNGLITKLRSMSKSMTSQTGQQIIRMHILPNISRSKGSQTIKLGPLMDIAWEMFFLKIRNKIWSGSLFKSPL